MMRHQTRQFLNQAGPIVYFLAAKYVWVNFFYKCQNILGLLFIKDIPVKKFYCSHSCYYTGLRAMTFYFYDLETSGISPRRDRVMQFAGQRTDTDLEPIGEPDNFLVKLSPDTLPQPEAILVTGITPQKTIAEGITEAEFLKIFSEKVSTPDTMIIGFNNIRFDDEFMRFMLWRNFYDAY